MFPNLVVIQQLTRILRLLSQNAQKPEKVTSFTEKLESPTELNAVEVSYFCGNFLKYFPGFKLLEGKYPSLNCRRKNSGKKDPIQPL